MTEIRHYKCLSDLQKLWRRYGNCGRGRLFAASIPLYTSPEVKVPTGTVMGIRICDYQFNFDETWIQPNPQMGLSFSSTWDNLQIVYGMQTKKAKINPLMYIGFCLRLIYRRGLSLLKI